MSMRLFRWAWLPAIVLVIALAIVLRPAGGSAPAGAQAANNAMSVALVVPGNKGLGSPFDVNLNITAASNAWVGWQGNINYDPAILAYVPVGPDGWVYMGVGGTTSKTPPDRHGLEPGGHRQ